MLSPLSLATSLLPYPRNTFSLKNLSLCPRHLAQGHPALGPGLLLPPFPTCTLWAPGLVEGATSGPSSDLLQALPLLVFPARLASHPEGPFPGSVEVVPGPELCLGALPGPDGK